MAGPELHQLLHRQSRRQGSVGGRARVTPEAVGTSGLAHAVVGGGGRPHGGGTLEDDRRQQDEERDQCSGLDGRNTGTRPAQAPGSTGPRARATGQETHGSTTTERVEETRKGKLEIPGATSGVARVTVT